ncbi:hypothetical protein QRX60_15105 [Amycolatopsis mongoliensis]|uniref:Uncharacterized protein n=1 Tax=Amycolatopsis mongoliensis TaxID=715475 RepID=A0A9Y2JXI0_9PSEU|nr:hypothetical protein [Amycolatopsis sp. 4-36]WIY05097.1 hypothetical protein QRX60_15105 [Amycolatopsis sp. 4-36]
MTVRLVIPAIGPDTAAHSAKNAHAASGLANNHHAGSYSERSPMVSTLTPRAIERLAIRRFTDTGRSWAKAPAATRRTWLAEVEPVIRAEHGIALDAVWHGGGWQAPGQTDLFDVPEVA